MKNSDESRLKDANVRSMNSSIFFVRCQWFNAELMETFIRNSFGKFDKVSETNVRNIFSAKFFTSSMNRRSFSNCSIIVIPMFLLKIIVFYLSDRSAVEAKIRIWHVFAGNVTEDPLSPLRKTTSLISFHERQFDCRTESFPHEFRTMNEFD